MAATYLYAEDMAVVAAGRVGDQVRDALAAVGCELLKESFGLGFCERSHGGLVCVRVCEDCL